MRILPSGPVTNTILFFTVVIVASFKYSLMHIFNLKLLFLSMSQKGKESE